MFSECQIVVTNELYNTTVESLYNYQNIRVLENPDLFRSLHRGNSTALDTNDEITMHTVCDMLNKICTTHRQKSM